jgi:hypothetical protein
VRVLFHRCLLLQTARFHCPRFAVIITDAPVPCIQKDTHHLTSKKKCRAPVDVSTVAAVRGVPVVVVEIPTSPLVSASQPFFLTFPPFFHHGRLSPLLPSFPGWEPTFFDVGEGYSFAPPESGFGHLIVLQRISS